MALTSFLAIKIQQIQNQGQNLTSTYNEAAEQRISELENDVQKLKSRGQVWVKMLKTTEYEIYISMFFQNVCVIGKFRHFWLNTRKPLRLLKHSKQGLQTRRTNSLLHSQNGIWGLESSEVRRVVSSLIDYLFLVIDRTHI